MNKWINIVQVILLMTSVGMLVASKVDFATYYLLYAILLQMKRDVE
jgi:hypothetical protein